MLILAIKTWNFAAAFCCKVEMGESTIFSLSLKGSHGSNNVLAGVDIIFYNEWMSKKLGMMKNQLGEYPKGES